LSNASEEEYLATSHGQEESAEAIFKALKAYKEEIETK
jgi:N-acetylmuramoyl-L-alanine amidase